MKRERAHRAARTSYLCRIEISLDVIEEGSERMITPFFTVDQDDEFVFIEVRVSHIRFSSKNLEIVVDEELFVFSLSPYYLRIRFPYPCVDDERALSLYDSKRESVDFRLPKANKGQHFPDLDLTAKLLARPNDLNNPEQSPVGNDQNSGNKKLIEDLDVETDISKKHVDLQQTLEEGENFNWEVQQTMPLDEEEKLTPSLKYGFCDQYEGIIGISVANGNDINELSDPEGTPSDKRVVERVIKENIKFDMEYYAADYIQEKYPSPDDDKLVRKLLEWKNPIILKFLKWYKEQQSKPQDKRESIMPVEFNQDERQRMINLPRKQYLVEPQQRIPLLLCCLAALFAYHFDLRETEGEHNIESAWTTGKLIPQFAFLDSKLVAGESTANSLESCIIACSRRSLSYPLHRNYSLLRKAWDDVYFNLRCGKRLVLKSLLDLRELFRFHDVYYVYDKIWLANLCCWIISDSVSESTIRSLAHDLKRVLSKISKAHIVFEKVLAPDQEESHDGDNNVDRGNDDDDDQIEPLNLEEIEAMAEELFRDYELL